VACACATVQLCLLLVFPGLRRSRVRVALGLIAVADIAGSTWWISRDPAALTAGTNGNYAFSLVCGSEQLQLLVAEVCTGWWTVLLGIYSAVWAYYVNALAEVPVAVDVVFSIAGVLLPFSELLVPTLTAGVSCPSGADERSSVSGAFSFFAFAHIFAWIACLASVTSTWVQCRLSRKGCPRLLALPLTCIFARGLWPLVWISGWIGEGNCGDGWIAAWGVLAAMLSPAHLVLFWANAQTMRTAKQDAPRWTGFGWDESKEHLIHEDEPEPETPIDVLWGGSLGVAFALVPSPKHRVQHQQVQDGEVGSNVTFATTHLGGTLSDPGAILQLQTPSGEVHSPPPIRSVSIQRMNGGDTPKITSPKKDMSVQGGSGAEWLAPAVVGGLQDPHPHQQSRTIWTSG